MTLETRSIQIALSRRFFMISFGSFFLFVFGLLSPDPVSAFLLPSDCWGKELPPTCWALSVALALLARSPAADEIVPSGIIDELSDGTISAFPPPPELSKPNIKVR